MWGRGRDCRPKGVLEGGKLFAGKEISWRMGPRPGGGRENESFRGLMPGRGEDIQGGEDLAASMTR